VVASALLLRLSPILGSSSLTLTNRGFSGGYHEYFGPNVDDEGVVYLMLVCISLWQERENASLLT